MKRIFDRKISDKNISGYNSEEIKNWLSNVKQIDSFKYYHYRPHAKFPSESKTLENQPTGEVLSFLDAQFSESPSFFVEIQQKVYKSGKWEIILKGANINGEISKIAVLSFKKTPNETIPRKR